MTKRLLLPRLLIAIVLFCAAQSLWAINMCSVTSTTLATDNLFDSGGTSGQYQDDEDCFLVIQPPGATSITLGFSFFNLERNFDFVRIYDGNSTAAPLLATLTGNLNGSNVPGPFTSSGGALLVRFTSNFSVTRPGFRASWSSVIAPSVLDHFAISHDQSAVACSEESITITAHDTFEGTFSEYTGSVTITARDTATNSNTGSWSLLSGSNPGSFVDNGDGTASYQYISGDNGAATFGYTQTVPSTINFDVTDGSLSELPAEDNNLIVANALAAAGNFRDEFGGGDYRDDFNTIAYNNSDGEIDWSSSGWIETDPSGNGAAGGDVRITGGRLELTGNNLNPAVKASAEREVDLTGYTSAVFRFALQTTSVESNDISTVAVSNNGGASWTTIFTFADDVQVLRPFSFDITPFISSNTRIRFRIEDENGGGCCYGPSDEVLEIESVEITSSTASTYGNNDGTLNWAGNWQESDGDGSGSGPISIYGGELYLYGDSSAVVTMSRAADLSSYGDATLTFDYRGIGNIDSSDVAMLQVSSGGSGWITLRTYTGNVSGADSISLLGHLAADTQIRFVIDDPGTGGSCCYNANDEAFVIDNVDIAVFTPLSCITGPDHFNINHAGTAVNCQAEPITISAHLADDSVDSSYTGVLSLSTSSGNGDWFLSTGSSIAIGSDTGNASYNFTAGDAGSVVLLLRNTHVETISINVADGAVTETSGAATAAEDPNLTFDASGFRFYDGVATIPIATQLSGKNSNVSDQSLLSDLFLQAINTNVVTGACEALLVGPQAINFSFDCINPNSCAGVDVQINGTTIPESSSGTQPVSLDFGTNTVDAAGFVFNYRDAGSIRLNASFNLTPSGLLAGSSTNFVVKPAGLCVEALGGTDPVCGALLPLDACSIYLAAGAPFDLRVTAMDWVVAGEANDSFCDNSVTPNFQLNTIALSSAVIAPISGNNGTLLNGSTDIPAGGTVDQAETFSEVGVFAFTATPPLYLGQSLAASRSADVGRFIPDHFEVTASLINRTDTNTQASCSSSYTFLDEELTISFNVTAHQMGGGITTNYEGAYAKLDGMLALGDDSGNDSGAINVVARQGTTVYHSANRLSGTGPTVSMAGGTHTGITFPVSIDRISAGGGFDAETALTSVEFALNPIDSDGVESNGILSINMPPPENFTSVGSTDLYFGRIVVEQAYGPEIRPLPLWTHTEYCTMVDTATTPDSCTVWQDLNQRVNPSQDDCSQLNLTPLTNIDIESWSGGSSYVVGTSALFQPFDGIMNRGGGGWRLDYTGGATSYQVLVPALGASTVNNYHPYLLLQQGQANFGSYRGHDRIIYWRENHNP